MKIFNFQTLALLAATLLSGAVAGAQPDANNTPKATNPAQLDWTNLPPEQRRELVQNKVAGMLRAAMTRTGTTDEDAQNAVIAIMRKQDEIYQPVRELQTQIARALIDNTSDEEQVAAQMDELRAESDKAREARDVSIADLENQIGFSTKPRLDALLRLVGLVGHDGIYRDGVATEIGVTLSNLAAVQGGKKAGK